MCMCTPAVVTQQGPPDVSRSSLDHHCLFLFSTPRSFATTAFSAMFPTKVHQTSVAEWQHMQVCSVSSEETLDTDVGRRVCVHVGEGLWPTQCARSAAPGEGGVHVRALPTVTTTQTIANTEANNTAFYYENVYICKGKYIKCRTFLLVEFNIWLLSLWLGPHLPGAERKGPLLTAMAEQNSKEPQQQNGSGHIYQKAFLKTAWTGRCYHLLRWRKGEL